MAIHFKSLVRPRSMCIVIAALTAMTPLTSAWAVNHGDQNLDNYVGVQWHYGITETVSFKGPGLTQTTSPNYWVEVTKRINGIVVCQERNNDIATLQRYDLGARVEILICGGTAKLDGERSYYDGPEPQIAPKDENWVDSPRHSFWNWTESDRGGDDRYWYTTWDSRPHPERVMYQDVATGFCLDNSGDYHVHTQGCNGGLFQRWVWRGQTLVDAATGFCLDSGGDFNVAAHQCNGGDFQKWLVRGQTLVDAATGFCLDSGGDGNVAAHGCNGGAFQNWQIRPQ